VVSYTYRHSFVTDALENGVGVAQVAELLGHTSTDMVPQAGRHPGDAAQWSADRPGYQGRVTKNAGDLTVSRVSTEARHNAPQWYTPRARACPNPERTSIMNDRFFARLLLDLLDRIQRQHEQQYTLTDMIRCLEEQCKFLPDENPKESREKQTTEEDHNAAMDDVTDKFPPERIYQELLADEKMVVDGNSDMINYPEACLGEKIKSVLMLTPGGAFFITSFRGLAPTGERPMPSYEDLNRLNSHSALATYFFDESNEVLVVRGFLPRPFSREALLRFGKFYAGDAKLALDVLLERGWMVA